MKGFKLFDNYNGLVADDNEGTQVYGWNSTENTSDEKMIIPAGGSVFGYVHKGWISVTCNERTYSVNQGEYFTTPDGAVIIGTEEYRFAAWRRSGHYGVMTKGVVESFGRMNYIDGCKDTILSSPVRKGDPCLNALYMPEGVHQTMHTHPSTRSGFIFVGGATCETPDGSFALEEGQIFFLEKDHAHKFRSDHGKDITMKLVAYHPDSDFGPEDENHPMINRTIVGGVSASHIVSIHTK